MKSRSGNVLFINCDYSYFEPKIDGRRCDDVTPRECGTRPSEELAKIDVDVWVKWWTALTRRRRDNVKDGDRCVENLP